MKDSRIIKVFSVSSLILTILFVAVFTYLAINYDYPDNLDYPAQTTLPSIDQAGYDWRAIWFFYALLPVGYILVGMTAYMALKPTNKSLIRMGVLFTVLASIFGTLGLARWPTIMPPIAKAYQTADASQRAVLEAIFNGVNLYLGNYLGEFMSEFLFGAFIVLVGITIFAAKGNGYPRWFGVISIISGVLIVTGSTRMFFELTKAANEYTTMVLPVYLILFSGLSYRAASMLRTISKTAG